MILYFQLLNVKGTNADIKLAAFIQKDRLAGFTDFVKVAILSAVGDQIELDSLASGTWYIKIYSGHDSEIDIQLKINTKGKDFLKLKLVCISKFFFCKPEILSFFCNIFIIKSTTFAAISFF